MRNNRPRMVAFLNSYTTGMSGGDACFIEIAKRLPEMDVIVVTSLMGSAACRSRGLDCRFWITSHETTFGNIMLIYLARIIKAIWCTLQVRNGDVLYATSDFLPDVLPAFVSKLRLPTCAWLQKSFHVIPSSRPVPHRAQRLSHMLIRQRSDMVIVDNSLLARELMQRGIPPDRVRINYPGIDAAYYQHFRATNPSAKVFDASYLGRIHASKGVFALIDIWRQVCRHRPSSRLAVIGSGEHDTVEALRVCIAAAGLADNVAILGYLETDDAVRVLNQSKIFVFPSPEEGFGMAVLEAMAVGLPVVAWDLPIYREVFPIGLVRVPVGDRRGFVEAVLSLLGDERLAMSIVAEASNLPATYDWHLVAARERQLIQELDMIHSPVGRV